MNGSKDWLNPKGLVHAGGAGAIIMVAAQRLAPELGLSIPVLALILSAAWACSTLTASISISQRLALYPAAVLTLFFSAAGSNAVGVAVEDRVALVPSIVSPAYAGGSEKRQRVIRPWFGQAEQKAVEQKRAAYAPPTPTRTP